MRNIGEASRRRVAACMRVCSRDMRRGKRAGETAGRGPTMLPPFPARVSPASCLPSTRACTQQRVSSTPCKLECCALRSLPRPTAPHATHADARAPPAQVCCIQRSCQLPPPTPFIECFGMRVFGGEKPADAPAWGDIADTSQIPKPNTLTRHQSDTDTRYPNRQYQSDPSTQHPDARVLCYEEGDTLNHKP